MCTRVMKTHVSAPQTNFGLETLKVAVVMSRAGGAGTGREGSSSVCYNERLKILPGTCLLRSRCYGSGGGPAVAEVAHRKVGQGSSGAPVSRAWAEGSLVSDSEPPRELINSTAGERLAQWLWVCSANKFPGDVGPETHVLGPQHHTDPTQTSGPQK